MRVVLLGAPGSGKGTQAALLSETWSVPHISTGDLLRAAVQAESALGLKAKVSMDKGELVSDELMLGLIEERLGQSDTTHGFLLDGYPRNLGQAESLADLLQRLSKSVEVAVQLDVDNEEIVQRLANRADQEGRVDDAEEVVRNRLRVYEEQTAPVVDFYVEQGVLSRVLASGSIEEVNQRIQHAVKIQAGEFGQAG